MHKPAQNPDPREAPTDTGAKLEFDLACALCGYNLRGLSVSSACPECGATVCLSVHGNPLSAMDAEWLATVRRGAAWMTVGLPWFWCPLVLPVFVSGLWRLARLPPARSPAAWIAPPALLEFVALLLLLTPLAPITIALCVRRLAKRGQAKGLVTCAAWVILLTTLAAIGLGAAWINEVRQLDNELLMLGAVIGVPAAAAALVLLWLMLAWTWRMLEAAEAQSRALREEPGAWRFVPTNTATATPDSPR